MSIRKVRIEIKGLTPYSGGNFFESTPDPNEKADAFDARCWRERIHATPDGRCFIPPRAIKSALDGAAGLRGERVGGGKSGAAWRPRFETGIQPASEEGDGVLLDAKGAPVMRDTAPGERVMAYAQGHKTEEESRVPRMFPVVPRGWTTAFNLLVTDEKIDKATLLRHLETAGYQVGLGRYRPQNRGEYGMFTVSKVTWSEL